MKLGPDERAQLKHGKTVAATNVITANICSFGAPHPPKKKPFKRECGNGAAATQQTIFWQFFGKLQRDLPFTFGCLISPYGGIFRAVFFHKFFGVVPAIFSYGFFYV